jgi:hypothetical protein
MVVAASTELKSTKQNPRLKLLPRSRMILTCLMPVLYLERTARIEFSSELTSSPFKQHQKGAKNETKDICRAATRACTYLDNKSITGGDAFFHV